MRGRDLTDSERQFLIDHAGLAPADLTPMALADAREAAQRAVAISAAEVRANALAPAEAAAILGTTWPEIIRLTEAGVLYSVPGDQPGGEPLIPAWQLAERRLIPHLRDVIAALTVNTDPLSVRHFMTTATEGYLDGMSPAAWLLAGQRPDPVIRFADDLARI